MALSTYNNNHGAKDGNFPSWQWQWELVYDPADDAELYADYPDEYEHGLEELQFND